MVAVVATVVLVLVVVVLVVAVVVAAVVVVGDWVGRKLLRLEEAPVDLLRSSCGVRSHVPQQHVCTTPILACPTNVTEVLRGKIVVI